jgi:ubiquitin conjugation factor E4 B
MVDRPASSTPSPPPEAAEPAANPRITITNSTTQPEAQAENPFMKLGVQPANGSGGPPIRISPADSNAKRAREDSDLVTASPPPRKSTATPKEETLDAFESRILSNIFRITLEEGAHDHSGHKLIFLPNLKKELEEAGEPVRLSVGTLDSAILEAASKIPHNKAILDYLLPSWKRTTRALKGIRGHATGRDTVLKEARRLCMSNIIFAVTVPELFRSVAFLYDKSAH